MSKLHSGFIGFDTAELLSRDLYEKEVLRLKDGETELALDEQVAVEAQRYGVLSLEWGSAAPSIRSEVGAITERYSALTTSSESQSFYSNPSQSSRSTTSSRVSRTSRSTKISGGQYYFHPLAPALENVTGYSERSALAPIEDDVVEESVRPQLSKSRSSFSTYSSGSSGPRSPSWLIGTGRFGLKRKKGRRPKIYRKDTSSCHSLARHGYHAVSNPSAPIQAEPMPCGHSLSKFSIRVHVVEALENEGDVPPNCCGAIFPADVLRAVLSTDEFARVIASYPNEYSSHDATDAVKLNEADLEPAVRQSSLCDFKFSLQSSRANSEVQSLAPGEDENAEMTAQDRDVQVLIDAQRGESERAAAFEAGLWKALAVQRDQALDKISSVHSAAMADKLKEYALAMERLEEIHVAAEHDLRLAHANESQRVATALRHMTAYCTGSSFSSSKSPSLSTSASSSSAFSASSTSLPRMSADSDTLPAAGPAAGLFYTVTEADHAALRRQQQLNASLAARHASAINVLRARQERQVERLAAAQGAEIEEVRSAQEEGEREVHLLFAKEGERLDVVCAERRERAGRRWEAKLGVRWGAVKMVGAEQWECGPRERANGETEEKSDELRILKKDEKQADEGESKAEDGKERPRSDEARPKSKNGKEGPKKGEERPKSSKGRSSTPRVLQRQLVRAEDLMWGFGVQAL